MVGRATGVRSRAGFGEGGGLRRGGGGLWRGGERLCRGGEGSKVVCFGVTSPRLPEVVGSA